MGVIGKTLKFTAGLALGAGIGAVGAMLVAPQSGKVTTDEIKARVNAVLDAGKDAQSKREKELQTYWEQEINSKADSNKEKAKSK
ncbi:MAG: YtxH domain-containing protein [Chloroflexota bacterium]